MCKTVNVLYLEVLRPQPMLWQSLILHIYPAVPQSQFFGLKASKLLRGEGNGVAVNTAGNKAQASTATTQENVLEWVKKDKRRMLHVVYRVGDLERTIKYITSTLYDLLDELEISYSMFWLNFERWLQVLHRMLGNEAFAKTWPTWRKIHKCLSWLWARGFSICYWTNL